jgi:hypothetical protein
MSLNSCCPHPTAVAATGLSPALTIRFGFLFDQRIAARGE